MSVENGKVKFEQVLTKIIDELVGYAAEYKLPEDALDWYRRSLQYNTAGGKLNRGLAVIDTYKILTGSLSEKEYLQTAILGWCIELLQAFFLVADDIMDDSKTRRGQLCYFRLPNVKSIAINDSFMIETSIYKLLKSHFKSEKYYVNLLELFQEVTFQTELGQLLDLITAPEDVVDLSKFSLAKHSFIVRFKTAYYSFYLPVALAMYMAGISDEKDLKQASDILIPLGEYFQVQDDYLDCYGDPNVIGKIGTDIFDNKCSWVVNTALLKATPEQRAILDNNYGVKNSDSEAKCKKVFAEINIPKLYEEYEESTVAKINNMISQLDESRGLKKEVFEVFLKKIYKRSK